MDIDPRLQDIDDCLYRVAVRVLVLHDNKVLLIKEAQHDWWTIPGGGIDHGETVEAALLRELTEELGVPADTVTTDSAIVHYTIGAVVNGVPRMNLFCKATVPETELRKTNEVSEWCWCTEEEFLQKEIHPSYDKSELATVIFKP